MEWSRASVGRVQAADHQRLGGGSKCAVAAGGGDSIDSVMLVMTPARRFALTG